MKPMILMAVFLVVAIVLAVLIIKILLPQGKASAEQEKQSKEPKQKKQKKGKKKKEKQEEENSLEDEDITELLTEEDEEDSYGTELLTEDELYHTEGLQNIVMQEGPGEDDGISFADETRFQDAAFDDARTELLASIEEEFSQPKEEEQDDLEYSTQILTEDDLQTPKEDAAEKQGLPQVESYVESPSEPEPIEKEEEIVETAPPTELNPALQEEQPEEKGIDTQQIKGDAMRKSLDTEELFMIRQMEKRTKKEENEEPILEKENSSHTENAMQIHTYIGETFAQISFPKDMEKAVFIRCNLTECSFQEGNLSGAVFQECKVRKTSFLDTCMDQAFISHCHFEEGNFKFASIKEATLIGNTAENSNFEKTEFDTSVIRSCVIKKSKFDAKTSLADAVLCEISIEDTNIEKLDLTEAVQMK